MSFVFGPGQAARYYLKRLRTQHGYKISVQESQMTTTFPPDFVGDSADYP
jgi:hypothetical protein